MSWSGRKLPAAPVMVVEKQLVVRVSLVTAAKAKALNKTPYFTKRPGATHALDSEN